MTRVGIFYGSTTGNTKDAALQIKTAWDSETVAVTDIAGAKAEDLAEFDLLILGTSTWGFGDWQDDWACFQAELAKVDWRKHQVALFGLGDQYGYADTFVDAMGLLYQALLTHGAEIIGAWAGQDYDFESSCAHRDGCFVGLALDADNQTDLTGPRIEQWVRQLKGVLSR
jgi:flavodoxin I